MEDRKRKLKRKSCTLLRYKIQVWWNLKICIKWRCVTETLTHNLATWRLWARVSVLAGNDGGGFSDWSSALCSFTHLQLIIQLFFFFLEWHKNEGSHYTFYFIDLLSCTCKSGKQETQAQVWRIYISLHYKIQVWWNLKICIKWICVTETRTF